MTRKRPDQVEPIHQSEYEEAFGIKCDGNGNEDSKQKRAHNLALDIRKFEIDLYWKRAGYFWTFIAATLAGFMLVQKDTTPNANSEYLSIVLGCVGFIFSFAWYCVNKGSKQWQENWENHVDLLEDSMVGPLYKIVTSRPSIEEPWWKPKGAYKRSEVLLTGPSAFSVSKINQIVSLFVAALWVALVVHVLPPFDFDWHNIEVKYAAVIMLAIIASIMIIGWGRTDQENRKRIRAKRRITSIE
jgi:hypothetical protein